MLIGRSVFQITRAILLSGLVLTSVVAQEKSSTPSPFKVGKFSANQIQQEVGYENMGLLAANPEIRARFAEIQKDRSQLSSKIISIKSEGDMERLQVELRILENKKNLLTQALSSLQYNDPTKALGEYVKMHWGDKFGLIYNSDNGSFWQSFAIISANYVEEDLNMVIGEKIKRELHLQENAKE
jgi:Flp pilus assembly secretin CpaC